MDFTDPLKPGFKEEFKKAFVKEPHKVILEMEALGIPVDDFRKQMSLGRDLTKSFFKEMTDNDMDAVEFTFWIAYMSERLMHELIIDSEVNLGARKEGIVALVEKLYFNQKITTVEDLYLSSEKKTDFISLLRIISGLRNDVAHGRFNKLTYGGFPLHDLKGQMKLTTDFKNAAVKIGV